MKKIIVAVFLAFTVTLVILFSLAPDVLSLSFMGLMTILVVWGCVAGILPSLLYTNGIRTARQKIIKLGEGQNNSVWASLKQTESLFRQQTLDLLFENYIIKVRRQESEGQLVSDIEEMINEDSLALRSYRGIMHQIPGTLTSMGLLGTFIGLILGISAIGFSSLEATLGSIELLLGGIRTAFFTSVAGVILSILFNIIYRLVWNAMLRELGMFFEVFHSLVYPTVEEQVREKSTRDMAHILERLDRLPKQEDLGMGLAPRAMLESEYSGEQRMMPDVRKGFLNGEFIFLLQPRYDLNAKKVLAAEALVRWDHAELGLIYPAAFMGVLERNGFVVRLDQYIWEQVCKTIRGWMDLGIRPVPVSVNVSKTDIMALDVADVLSALLEKYEIPPRYLEVEIDEHAYLECEDAAHEVEAELHKRGFGVIIDGFDEEFLAMHVMQNTQVDALKLDLKYMGSPSDKRDSAVETMLEQARKLKVRVLAKRIENAEQLSDLRRLGCAEGQGNYLKKPISVEEFERLMEYTDELAEQKA